MRRGRAIGTPLPTREDDSGALLPGDVAGDGLEADDVVAFDDECTCWPSHTSEPVLTIAGNSK